MKTVCVICGKELKDDGKIGRYIPCCSKECFDKWSEAVNKYLKKEDKDE